MAIQLNYKSFGQGNPIIILHGLFGTLDNWQTVGKQLSEDHTVFLVDQRNHGKSPHVVGHTYPLLAADLNHFMEEQWIFEATIIGHSMGGKTAMQFAMDYPDRVKQLVVVDIAPKSYDGGHELIINALLSLPLEKIASRTEAEELLQSFGVEEFSVRQFLLKNLTRTRMGKYEWKMNLSELHKNYERILANIELQAPFAGEALFIRGGKSDYISNEDWINIQQIFPNAQLETIPNAGHWVHAEAPNELIKSLLSFLK